MLDPPSSAAVAACDRPGAAGGQVTHMSGLSPDPKINIKIKATTKTKIKIKTKTSRKTKIKTNARTVFTLAPFTMPQRR